MSAYLVTGATGRQGGSVVRELLAKGAKVHALVRNASSDAAQKLESQGVVLYPGNYGDSTAVSKALDGVKGVFFVPPNPEPGYVQASQKFIRACAERRDVLESFVLSSAAGTELHHVRVKTEPNYGFAIDWSWRADLEDEARAAEFKSLTIFRCSFLFPNYLLPASQFIYPGLRTQNRLVTVLKPDTKIPHMNPEDMGLWAGPALLENPAFKGKEINLAAQNLTGKESAEILSSCAGVKVEAPLANYFDDSLAAMAPMMRYYEWANGIDASIDAAKLKEEYGITMSTLEQFLSVNQKAIKESLGVTQ